MLYTFKESRKDLDIPDMRDPFTKKLYATYLSYLPEDKFSYELTMHCDTRGSFTEMLKSQEKGQVSVNISKTGITKGNHWHSTKNEKIHSSQRQSEDFIQKDRNTGSHNLRRKRGQNRSRRHPAGLHPQHNQHGRNGSCNSDVGKRTL